MIRSFIELPGEEYSEGKNGVQEYRRIFRAETNGRVRPDLLKEHELFPRRYERHPNNPQAFCVSRRCNMQKKGSRFVDLEAFYTTDVWTDIENPLERPPQVDWTTVEYAEARLVDLDGRPLVNTAGEPLEDILIESPGLIANVTAYVENKPDWFRQYINAVNEGTISFDGEDFPSGELRIKSLSCGAKMNEQQIWFRELKLELQSREGGWQRKVHNRGYYEIAEKNVASEETGETAATKKKKYRRQIMIDGVPCVEPQFLDEDGKHLTFLDEEGQLIEENMKKIVLIDFRVRPERDFSILPLA